MKFLICPAKNPVLFIRFTHLLTFLCLIYYPASSVYPETLSLSLDQAFLMANEENLQLKISQQLIEDARILAIRDRAPILPRVTFESSQLRNKSSNLGMSSDSGDEGASRVSSYPPQNRFDAKIVATMQIANAPALAAWRLAVYNREISEISYLDAQQQVFHAVAQAYMVHQRNLAQRTVIAANIERDRVLLDLAVTQMKAGVSTAIDVTRAEVRLAADERTELQLKNEIELSGLYLKRLLSLPVDMDLILDEPEKDPKSPPLYDTADFEAILRERPDYIKIERELERNRYARKAAGWQSLPTLSIFTEWGVAASDVFNGDTGEEWSAGIAISVPIFEGYKIKSDKKYADNAIAMQLLALQELTESVETGYRAAINTLQTSFQTIGIARKQVKLSEKELDLAESRFSSGVADNRDLIEAQANLAAAQNGLIDSILLYDLARLDMARIRGNVLGITVR